MMFRTASFQYNVHVYVCTQPEEKLKEDTPDAVKSEKKKDKQHIKSKVAEKKKGL